MKKTMMKVWKIDDLKLDPKNVRAHPEKNIEAIKASLSRWGQQKPVVIDSSGVVRAGNGLVMAARALGWTEINTIQSNLEGAELTAYAIADNRTGELSHWTADIESVINELKMDLPDLDAAGLGFDDINALLDGDVDEDDLAADDTYTDKIIPPTYTPKGDKPAVTALYDRLKTDALIHEIQSAEIPKDVKTFLTYAAERHTVFNFRNIAEFYCHATEDVQELMERSGLVIIDMEAAIENGFVHLTERLMTLAKIEEKT